MPNPSYRRFYSFLGQSSKAMSKAVLDLSDLTLGVYTANLYGYSTGFTCVPLGTHSIPTDIAANKP